MIALQRRAAMAGATFLLSLAALQLAQAQSPAPEYSPIAKQRSERTAASTDRPRPQVIYNVANASHETVQRLHAQSKTAADYSLPIDASMPLSLQLARANANASAAAANAQREQIVEPAAPAEGPRVSRGEKSRKSPHAKSRNARGKDKPRDNGRGKDRQN